MNFDDFGTNFAKNLSQNRRSNFISLTFDAKRQRERIADEPPRDDDRERVVDHVSTSTTKYLAAAQTHINVGAE